MTQPKKPVKIADRVHTRLKIKQLHLLVAIAHRSSVLHAARDLNMSQPAATKLLKDLELDFGVPLFDRTNRGVVPTVYGAALVKRSKLILAQIADAAEELDDLNEGTGGRIQVGTLLAASANLLPQAIICLKRQRPNVNVLIREGTNDILMPALRDGDLDLVVGRLPEYRYREELAQERLVEEQICIVAGKDHPLAGRSSVRFEELVRYDWILPPRDTTLRRQLDNEFSTRGLESPNAALESISFLTNRSLLAATDMLGALPFHVVENELRMGLMAIVPCELKLTAGPIGVSYRSAGPLSPAAENFLQILRQVGAEMSGKPQGAAAAHDPRGESAAQGPADAHMAEGRR